MMKTQNRFFRLVLLVILTIGLTSCSKDEVVPPVQVVDTDKDGITDSDDQCPSEAGPASNQGCPDNTGGDGQITENDGITEEDLETYKGDIGMVLNTRELAKKGYYPVKAQLEVKGTSADYSQTIDLDPYAFMGQIKLPVEDLSEADLETLKNGVEVIAKLFDAGGSEIFTETFTSILFKPNPVPATCNPNNLPDLNTEVEVVENTAYYIQAVKYENNQVEPENRAAFRRILRENPLDQSSYLYNDLLSMTSTIEFTGDEENSSFFFEAIEGKANHFNIKHQASDSYLKSELMKYGFLDLGYDGIKVGHEKTDRLNQQFVLHKVTNGVYRVTDAYFEPIKVTPGVGLTVGAAEGEELLVRLVPMNIDWEVQEIETHYLEPLLPAAQNGFSYNSTLTNCGSGSLEQTIGNSQTEETITTVGWEESFSFMSSNTSSFSLTVGMEVEGKFFGNGAKYSAEASAGAQFTTQSSTETSNWNEATGTKSQTFFSERTITVPAKSAVLAYDAFQRYDNIKVNVVQRVQVKGRNQINNQALSGKQIATQFHFNGFDGVITQIGPDYAEVTIRGVATMDKIFNSKSDVQEVNANCQN
ncbi:hypothetical protein FK220_018415 [Flavobacteriaceae bacterium TP-CH-4]|uniref:Uncharacterized protein n=1 Tax=Pelagihabitans pacificus TaxID=2696054 RepID=A0A967AVT8_9FLAO|nr:hypothetical protein [Pelagihabitans pacificus]NHF61334.1 hypothetical protein [Pelagihabitans pacificus]